MLYNEMRARCCSKTLLAALPLNFDFSNRGGVGIPKQPHVAKRGLFSRLECKPLTKVPGVRSTTQYPLSTAMQKDEYMSAYRHVISMERLVREVRGVQTPSLYHEIKHFGINKNTRWEAFVERMTALTVVERIEWCEVFLEDLQLLHQHTVVFEKSMIKRGVDLEHRLGSQEHEHKKLHMLLYQGENTVFSEDVCEDVLLRSARRLCTLVGWAHEVRVSVDYVSDSVCLVS